MMTRLTAKNCILMIALGYLGVAAPASGQVMNEQHKILAFDGASGDHFGNSVDISNGIIAISAIWDDRTSNTSGSVYLYKTDGEFVTKLRPSPEDLTIRFGTAIAIDNEYVIVGDDTDSEQGVGAGTAFIFDTTQGSYTKIFPSDPDRLRRFGSAVDIDNGIIAVSATHGRNEHGIVSGAVYLFDIQTGKETFKLSPDDGATSDEFGVVVAVEDGIIAIGSMRDDDNGLDSGSAYVFDAFSGELITKLTPTNGSGQDLFGYSIAIDNGLVAVGAIFYDTPGKGNDNAGAVYIFDAHTGEQIQMLVSSPTVQQDDFGISLDFDNGIVVVGTSRLSVNRSGGVYIFDAEIGEEIGLLRASDRTHGDELGRSVVIEKGIVIAGVEEDDDFGKSTGSAYIFYCPADLTGNFSLDVFDVSAFLKAFASNGPIADFTNDGIWDFFDVSAFLQAFAAGCP